MKKLIIPAFALFLAACALPFAPPADEGAKRNSLEDNTTTASVEADPDDFPESGGDSGGFGPPSPPSPDAGGSGGGMPDFPGFPGE